MAAVPFSSRCPSQECPISMPVLHTELERRVTTVENRLWAVLTIGITSLIGIAVQLLVLLIRK